MARAVDVPALAAALRAGDRRALARAITLAESTLSTHRDAAEALLAAVLPAPGPTFRLGLSGAPGVGKSTLIEALGLHAVGLGRRLAVLAVDPSSPVAGGAILGDKTRMERLTQSQAAFIRPSPAGTTLGGVARRTRDALLLAEAAGFDLVIVETVGVGQSETAVADMTDMFCLVLPPAGGDELQGLKKGVVELADLVLVNKADGDLAAAAGRTVAEYRSALGLVRRRRSFWTPTAQACSAATGAGIAEAWAAFEAFRAAGEAAGAIAAERQTQSVAQLWREAGELWVEALRAAPALAALRAELEAAVASGAASPAAAARRLLAAYGDQRPAAPH